MGSSTMRSILLLFIVGVVLTGSLIAKPLTEGDRCPRQLHYHTVMIDECLLVNATVSCPAKPGAQCRPRYCGEAQTYFVDGVGSPRLTKDQCCGKVSSYECKNRCRVNRDACHNFPLATCEPTSCSGLCELRWFEKDVDVTRHCVPRPTTTAPPLAQQTDSGVVSSNIDSLIQGIIN